MKKLFAAVLLVMFLASCRKHYTCECYTNYTYMSSNKVLFSMIIPGDVSPYNVKMSRKKAEAACRHERTAIESNFTNGVTGEGYYPLKEGESVKTSCTLK